MQGEGLHSSFVIHNVMMKAASQVANHSFSDTIFFVQSQDVQTQQDFKDHSHRPCHCLHYFNGRLEGGERGGCNSHRVTEGGRCSDADANDVTQLVHVDRQSVSQQGLIERTLQNTTTDCTT